MPGLFGAYSWPVAKRRMLILVKVAPPPPPPPVSSETADGEEGASNGTKKSEVKTGFFGVAGAGAGGSGSAGGAGGGTGGMLTLGQCDSVVQTLAHWNVSPDGSGPEGWGETPGMATLYGPGCVMELPTGGDGKLELSQVMVTVTDEDFAWPVLSRLCKANSWKMMDPESGRMFG